MGGPLSACQCMKKLQQVWDAAEGYLRLYGNLNDGNAFVCLSSSHRQIWGDSLPAKWARILWEAWLRLSWAHGDAQTVGWRASRYWTPLRFKSDSNMTSCGVWSESKLTCSVIFTGKWTGSSDSTFLAFMATQSPLRRHSAFESFSYTTYSFSLRMTELPLSLSRLLIWGSSVACYHCQWVS